MCALRCELLVYVLVHSGCGHSWDVPVPVLLSCWCENDDCFLMITGLNDDDDEEDNDDGETTDFLFVDIGGIESIYSPNIMPVAG